MDRIKSEIIQCSNCPNNDGSQLFKDIAILKAVVVNLKQWLRDIHQQLEEEEENPAQILQKMKFWLKSIPADLREEEDSGTRHSQSTYKRTLEEEVVHGDGTMEEEDVPDTSYYGHQGGYEQILEYPGQQLEIKEEVDDFEYVCEPIIKMECNSPDYDTVKEESCEDPLNSELISNFNDRDISVKQRKAATQILQPKEGSKPAFYCAKCGREYTSSSLLKLHNKKNCENRKARFQCKSCTRVFTRRDAMEKHVNRKNCEVRSSAVICIEHKMTYQDVKEARIRCPSCKLLFKCLKCDKEVKSKQGIRSHFKQKHPKEDNKQLSGAPTPNENPEPILEPRAPTPKQNPEPLAEPKAPSPRRTPSPC